MAEEKAYGNGRFNCNLLNYFSRDTFRLCIIRLDNERVDYEWETR